MFPTRTDADRPPLREYSMIAVLPGQDTLSHLKVFHQTLEIRLIFGAQAPCVTVFFIQNIFIKCSFENGVGAALSERFKENGGRLLTIDEVERIVNELAEHPMQKPYLNDARTKMASRDFSFRDAYHGNIADYLQAVTPEEFERFIGDQSIDFDRILADNKDVLRRLKQAEDE